MSRLNTQSKLSPLRDFPITTLLIASFVGIFTWQIINGVDASSPSTHDLMVWGANTLAPSMSNEPWRLLTAGFLHIGMMHLMFNSFAIYYFGQVAEQMWGRVQLLFVFVLAVVGGNLLNCYLAWQNLLEKQTQPSLSAGASGGVMGIGAGLLVCALFKVQLAGVQLNLKSLLMIMAFNLSFGFIVPGIDNAGHIGGALTGGILVLVIAMTWRLKPLVQSMVFFLTAMVICYGFYRQWDNLHNTVLPYLSS